MKNLYSLLLCFFSLSISAQDILGEWYFYNIVDLDVYIFNTDYPQMNIVFYEDSGDYYFSGNAVCNSFASDPIVFLQNDYFEAFPPYWTLVSCGAGDEDFFEGLYYSFFYYNYDTVNNTPTHYDYTITGTGNDAILTISNIAYSPSEGTNIGYIVTYGRQTLDIAEKKSQVSIKLKNNPVESSLELISNSDVLNSGANTYKIFSLDGKEVSFGILKYDIDTSALKQGMYFIEILLDQGNRQVIKFIKQ